MKHYFISFLLLFCSTTAMAMPAPKSSLPRFNVTVCPTADELKLDHQRHWWASKTAPDSTSNNPHAMLRYKWYSTSSSLAKGISRFAGAQYLGSSEGHVVCLYIPKISADTEAFPILIYFEFLSLRPNNSQWNTDLHNKGLLNCINSDPEQCPYLVYQPERITDPYKALREL